jgi:uroporphyrinogen decarboxylase
VNTKKWLNDQIGAKKKCALPFMFYPSAALLEVSVEDLISNASLTAEGLACIAERYDLGAVMRMAELWPEAEAFGASITFERNTFPKISDIVISCEDINTLCIPGVDAGHTGMLIESVWKTSKLLPGRPIFAGVTGPFSLCGVLMDLTEMMMNCYSDPELSHVFLGKVTEFLISYCKEYKSAGGAGIILAEPSSTMLSPKFMDEFSNSYIKMIIESVRDDDFAVIYHNCGDVNKHLEVIASVGANAYHFGEPVDMAKAMQIFPQDVLVMGNISPTLFVSGAAERIKKAVSHLLSLCSNRPNFIISSGCDIPPVKNFNNIDAFFAAMSESAS